MKQQAEPRRSLLFLRGDDWRRSAPVVDVGGICSEHRAESFGLTSAFLNLDKIIMTVPTRRSRSTTASGRPRAVEFWIFPSVSFTQDLDPPGDAMGIVGFSGSTFTGSDR